MSISINKPLALKLRFADDSMWVDLTDGRTLGIPLAYFPRLLNANKDQLENHVISGGGIGLHWEELDEDILVENLLLGIHDQTVKKFETV